MQKEDRMESLNKLAEVAKGNVGFLVICVTIVAAIILTAYGTELLIAKKTGTKRKNEKLKVRRMAIIAVLSAISVVLMLFKLPLWFVPSFYTLDFSELPVIIGAFTLGPVAGVVIESIKILLNLLIYGTQSVFVGELANFLIGCAFIVPASFLYFLRKSKKNAAIGLSAGTVITSILGGILNAYVLLPKYSELMGYPISAFIDMGKEKNQLISNMSTFVMFGVIPFNIIKFALVSVITILIYKKISHLLKAEQ